MDLIPQSISHRVFNGCEASFKKINVVKSQLINQFLTNGYKGIANQLMHIQRMKFSINETMFIITSFFHQSMLAK